MISETTIKKSMGLRNNSMVVLWFGHLSACQTKRDSWFLGAQYHKEYSNYLRNEFPILKKWGLEEMLFQTPKKYKDNCMEEGKKSSQ